MHLFHQLKGRNPQENRSHVLTVTSSGSLGYYVSGLHFARTIETPLCVRSRHLAPHSGPPSVPLLLSVLLFGLSQLIHPPASPQSSPFLPCLYVSLCLCSLACMHACDFFTCVYVCTRNPSPTEMSVEPWASPQDQAAAEHTDRTHTPPSQDQEQHPDKLCLDSFWSEVETIRQGSGYTDLDCTRRDSRQSEGKYCKS